MGNKDWWPITNTLLIKDNNAMANGDAQPFKLIVEGRIDKFFYSRIVNDQTEVLSISKAIRPRPSNIRKAIVGFMEELRNNPTQFKYIKPLGVVDSDYDNTVPDESNLVHTDTNDLETLLLSTGTFDISQYPGMNDNIKKSIECISYQFGHIRKAIFKYIEQKKYNIREFIDEEWLKDSFNLFCDVSTGLNMNKMINAFKLEPRNKKLFKDEMGCELLKMFLFARLRENQEADANNNLIHKPDTFDKDSVLNYWEPIRGHDVSSLVTTFVPSLNQVLEEQYQIYNLDSFIASRSNPQRIKNTKLFKAFENWGIAQV